MEPFQVGRSAQVGSAAGTRSNGRSDLRPLPRPPAIEVQSLTRSFGSRVALDGVSLAVLPGEVHALLGPNGAGKTVMLRTLTGLLAPSSGRARVMGADAALGRRPVRAVTGFVPAGDRTFYMRISALENLMFFARMHGLRRRRARGRALDVLEQVGLADRAHSPIGSFSHGMEKRLSVARALLTDPSVVLVDEATHDLDPDAAAGVRSLIGGLAREGAAVLWTTQRIDEIRGFADRVTLLREGRVRFAGSVNDLMARAQARRFVIRLGAPAGKGYSHLLQARLHGIAEIAPAEGQGEHWLLSLREGCVLGEAVATLYAAGIPVLACHRERSEIEEAFVSLSARSVE